MSRLAAEDGEPSVGSLLKRKEDNILFRIIARRMITEEYQEDSHANRCSWMSTRQVSVFDIESIKPVTDPNNPEETHILRIIGVKWNVGFVWYLGGINLRYANLKHIQIADIDFEGANFEGADLRGAKITRCNFKNANFKWVDLRTPSCEPVRGGMPCGKRTDLCNCDFEGADVTGTIYNEDTWFGRYENSVMPVINLNKQDMVLTTSHEERNFELTLEYKKNLFYNTKQFKIKF